MKEFDLAYQLMQAIRQTDEWEAIWQEYPGVTEAKAKLDTVMEQVSAAIPQELTNTLWEAMAALDWANECASVLYGVRLACSVSRAAADPAEFSEYARMRKESAGSDSISPVS